MRVYILLRKEGHSSETLETLEKLVGVYDRLENAIMDMITSLVYDCDITEPLFFSDYILIEADILRHKTIYRRKSAGFGGRIDEETYEERSLTTDDIRNILREFAKNLEFKLKRVSTKEEVTEILEELNVLLAFAKQDERLSNELKKTVHTTLSKTGALIHLI